MKVAGTGLGHDGLRMGDRSRWRYWLWLGLTSFGGPGAQIAAMQAEVVERRAWLTAEQFGRALGLCFFLPGPEAQQMVTWIAWKLDGWRAALFAALAFILPGLLACGLLGYAYVSYGKLPAVEGALVGVRAVVAGVILVSAWRLGSSSCVAWGQRIAAGLSFAGLWAGAPFAAIAATAAVWGWWGGRPEEEAEEEASGQDAGEVWRRLLLGLGGFGLLWVSLAAWAGWSGGLGRLAGVSALAVLTSFGGAYAALSLWRTQADAEGWLPADRFGDALVAGEATPGPLMLAGSFIGFVAGYQGLLGLGGGWLPGLLGLVVPAVFTFGISTSLILATAPLGEVGVASARFHGMMTYVTAAAAGALAFMGLSLMVSAGAHSLSLLLTAAALVISWRRWLGVPALLALGALLGWVGGR